jgi:hypothetical protein
MRRKWASNVNGYSEVDQIECRWVPERDLQPIASSFSAASTAAMAWFTRLGPAIRPNSGPAAPLSSMAYLTFEDGTAAVICRQVDINALPLQDVGKRRTLVARILVGSQQLLSPEVAMSLCLTGIRDVAGIPPGQVGPDSELPPISGGRLANLAGSVNRRLDEGARQQPGLDRLIAAALRDHRTPLAVQLPAHEIREPTGGPQGFLLWGLWRTTWQLLAGIHDPAAGARGWSFSTYEPPLDASDTSWLPGTVFRTQQPHQQAQMVRAETAIAPRDQAGSSAKDGYATLGAALADAYEIMSAEDLSDLLVAASDDSSNLHDRLGTARNMLRRFAAPAQTRVMPAAQESLPDARAAPYATAGTGVGQTREFEEPVAHPAVPESTSAGFGWQADAVRNAEPWTGTSAVAETPLPAQPVHPARPERNAADPPPRHHEDQGGNGHQNAVSDVLEWLAGSPDVRDFPAALEALRAGSPPPSRVRAAARDFMAGHDWYIPALAALDPSRIEEVLVAIFRQTVIPDLSEGNVCAEMAVWAHGYGAPAVVIRALIAAGAQAGDAHSSALERALTPALYRRWLIEHAIYTRPVAQSTAASWLETSPRKSRWKTLVAGERSAVIASVLVLLCLLLVIALVLSLFF